MATSRNKARSSSRRRFVAIAALVVASLAVVGAWARGRLSVDRDARAARRAVEAGRYAEARAPLARWLRARLDAPEAHFLEARAALASGQIPAALGALARARELGYPEPSIARVMAVLLARSGQDAAAEPLLRRVLGESTRPEPETARELARIYLETFRLGPAAAVLDRWTRDAPRDPTPYLWRTEIDRRTRPDPLALIEHYRAALDRDPALDRARLGLADALREAHRDAEAAVEYAAYLARHPRDPAAHLGLGRLAAQQGVDDDAAEHLDTAIALDPSDPRAPTERAALAVRRGDFDAALGLLDRAIRLAPDDPEPHHRRYLVLVRLGRREDARQEQAEADRLRAQQDEIDDLRRRLVRTPDDVDLQSQVARWMIGHGHADEGVRWARKVLGVRPQHAPTNRLLADYYDHRGEVGLANYYRLRLATPP